MLNRFGPHRDDAVTSREPAGPALIIRLDGDLTVPHARAVHDRLRAAARRRDIRVVVLDFTDAGRFDSAGLAALALGQRRLARAGKAVELRHLGDHHKAALALVPKTRAMPEPVNEPAGFLERVGERLYHVRGRWSQLATLLTETARQTAAVLARRRRLPAGAFVHQAVTLGVDALFIVGLLSFLMGMTLAFQGSIQLQRFGAGVYVVDLIGVSEVREFAPIMTAIILSGRAGAAIAAELGTMRAGSEIDALSAMGVSPVRFLVLPRLFALTVTQPALTLLAMFLGILGGAVVAAVTLDLSVAVFVTRIIDSVELVDFAHGVGKSVIFAWIIGVTGAFFGLHSSGNAGAVGAATTRTVVVCIFLVLLVDAAFATVPALVLGGPP